MAICTGDNFDSNASRPNNKLPTLDFPVPLLPTIKMVLKASSVAREGDAEECEDGGEEDVEEEADEYGEEDENAGTDVTKEEPEEESDDNG